MRKSAYGEPDGNEIGFDGAPLQAASDPLGRQKGFIGPHSKDGTTIAFDHSGAGPAIILRGDAAVLRQFPYADLTPTTV